MYFEIVFCFILAFIIIFVLMELYNYLIYSKDKCLKDVYFIADLKGDCSNVENVVRTLNICAGKFTGNGIKPSVIIITDNTSADTIKACRLLKKDFGNLKLLKSEELARQLTIGEVEN